MARFPATIAKRSEPIALLQRLFLKRIEQNTVGQPECTFLFQMLLQIPRDQQIICLNKIDVVSMATEAGADTSAPFHQNVRQMGLKEFMIHTLWAILNRQQTKVWTPKPITDSTAK